MFGCLFLAVTLLHSRHVLHIFLSWLQCSKYRQTFSKFKEIMAIWENQVLVVSRLSKFPKFHIWFIIVQIFEFWNRIDYIQVPVLLLPGQGGLLVVHFALVLPAIEPMLHWDTLWNKKQIKTLKKILWTVHKIQRIACTCTIFHWIFMDPGQFWHCPFCSCRNYSYVQYGHEIRAQCGNLGIFLPLRFYVKLIERFF